MPFGANLLMRITGVWPTVSRMLANFAIGSSSVHHCPTDDIGHEGRLHTGVPGLGRLRVTQSRRCVDGSARRAPTIYAQEKFIGREQSQQAACLAEKGSP
jgi:hypothetical protein